MWVEPEGIGVERTQILGIAILDQFVSVLDLPESAIQGIENQALLQSECEV